MVEISLFRGEPVQRQLGPGEELFAAGEPASEMYGVLDGGVDIVIDGAVVETVAAGGILGEMGILNDQPRSATARAGAEGATVAVVDEKRFIALVKINPFFSLDVMRILAERLERRAAES